MQNKITTKALKRRSRSIRILISGQSFPYRSCVGKFNNSEPQSYHLKMDTVIPTCRVFVFFFRKTKYENDCRDKHTIGPQNMALCCYLPSLQIYLNKELPFITPLGPCARRRRQEWLWNSQTQWIFLQPSVLKSGKMLILV